MEEQHPVPQDITGFKFKLVGDMTLKQFGELAFGAILAYLFYASNWHPILKWPLVMFFGFLGVALAFLPIEERPLDVWIINFLRAIYRPTYYVWKKDTSGLAIAAPSPQVLPRPALQAWPYPKVEPEKEKPTATVPTVSVAELEKFRAQKLAGKQEEKKVTNIVTVDSLAQMRSVVEPPWASGATGQARVVDRPVRATQTISLTDVPNIINGTVFDQRGAPMEGVVLVIKDKTSNSVRALKTNRVGQFIVSTPLEDGTYYLEFEMPNYSFNTYEIDLAGVVIAPLTIKGKYVGPK